MKHLNKILLMLAAGSLASCVDTGVEDYPVDPAFVEKQAAKAYLQEYEALKNYVAEKKGFDLGLALSGTDFAAKGGSYCLATSNFTQMTDPALISHEKNVDKNTGDVMFADFEKFVIAANDADMSVFGPALIQSEGQQIGYLKTLLADHPLPAGEMIEVEVKEKRRCLQIISHDKVANPWDSQFWIATPNVKWNPGDTWELTMMIKAQKEAGPGTQIHAAPSEYVHYAAVGSPQFTTEWTEWTGSGTFPNEVDGKGCYSIAWNLNDFAEGNKYFIDDVSFKINGVEQIKNGDFEGEEMENFYFVEQGVQSSPALCSIVDEISWTELQSAASVEIEMPVTEDRRCLQINSHDMVANPWDSQFWIATPNVKYNVGDTWELTMMVMAEKEASPGTQIHAAPSEYVHWAAVGNPNFTTEWTEWTGSGTFPNEVDGKGCYSIAWNLNDFAEGNKYFIDDVSFKINGVEQIKNGSFDTDENENFYFVEYGVQSSPALCKIVDKVTVTRLQKAKGIPQTPEEKKDTLNLALAQWINTAMDASHGLVAAWDLVSNVVADAGDDGEGNFPLRSANDPMGGGIAPDPENPKKTNFYWQDILGTEDFVRTTAKLVRDKQKDAQLFVAESKLADPTIGTKKTASLINWIKKWEADGVTKIDGVSVKLDVVYTEVAADQKAQEAAITAMFKQLAASGKKVRIGSLSMDFKNAKGEYVAAAAITTEQAQKMSAFYTAILKAYFAGVPAAQQAGICLSSYADNEKPLGLWDKGMGRKDTYAGFADGLK